MTNSFKPPRSSVLWVFSALLVLIVGYWIAVPPIFNTNDDVTIRLALTGFALPDHEPTGFVVLTHAGLGWILVWMQRFAPGVVLWDVLVAGSLILSLAVLLTTAFELTRQSLLSRFLTVGAFIVVVLPLCVTLQFTISSIVASVAAGVWMMSGIVPVDSAARPGRLVSGSLLFLLAALIRPMAALLAGACLLAGLLPVVALTLPGTLRRLRIRRVATVAVIILSVSGAVMAADRGIYATAGDWRVYRSYHWMVADLFEWGGELPDAEARQVRDAAGWSENDYRLLEGWWGVDTDLHGPNRVQAAYEKSVSLRTVGYRTAKLLARLGGLGTQTLRGVMLDNWLIWLSLVAWAIARADRQFLAVAAATALMFVLFSLAVTHVFKELPFRVLGPLYLCVWGCLALVPARIQQTPKGLRVVLGASLMLFAVTEQAVNAHAEAVADARHAQGIAREVEAFRSPARSLVVLHADAFPAEHWWRPFRSPRTGYFPFVALGSNNQSPPLQRFLARTYGKSLLRAMCEDPSMVIVSMEGRLEAVRIYWQEHLGKAVTFEQVHDGSFQAWRCSVTP